MKRFVSLLTTCSIVAATMGGGFIAAPAQKSDNKSDKDKQSTAVPVRDHKAKLPEGIKRGASPEAKAAWDSLKPEQREEVKRKVHEAIDKAKKDKEKKDKEQPSQKAARKTWKDIIKGKQGDDETDVTLLFTDKQGKEQSKQAKEREAGEPLAATMETQARLGAKSNSARATTPKRGAYRDDVFGGFAFMKASFEKPSAKTNFTRAAATSQVVTDSGVCFRSIEQFVAEAYQGSFARQPNADETQYWRGRIAASGLSAAKELGYALFSSPEYVNRGRTNEQFVYDLYKTWLMREPDAGGYNFWLNKVYAESREATTPGFAESLEFADNVARLCEVPSDRDYDGLPESFENQVADAFTPVYHVSAYEPDNFATFGNFVPQTVQQRLGKDPYSYFRVQPLGFGQNRYGQLVSVLRIDYLTLWDHDSGLVTGGYCDAFPGLNYLDGILPHDIDNERSAVLVAAPVGDYTYNLNPYAYSAYSYYTAAHEYAPNDKSRYADFSTNPVPAGNHIRLALSLSKHGTYTFNPDGLSLVPDYIIYAAIGALDYYCYRSFSTGFDNANDVLCLALSYYAYGIFYECATEVFINQGGKLATTRVNVGDVNAPINNSAFIQDDTYGLRSKFTNPVF